MLDKNELPPVIGAEAPTLICQTVPQGLSEDLHPHSSPAAEADGPGPAPRVGRLVQVRAELLIAKSVSPPEG